MTNCAGEGEHAGLGQRAAKEGHGRVGASASSGALTDGHGEGVGERGSHGAQLGTNGGARHPCAAQSNRARRGATERVRERGKLDVHFRRAQGHDSEASHAAVARGNGGSALLCMDDASAFHRTCGVQRGGQGGSRIGLDLGRIRHWAQNEV